jgi:hypothetical protein
VRQPDLASTASRWSRTRFVRPQPGRRYTVSRDPRYAWKVTAIAFDKIHLELFFEGEVADSYLDWPLDRWHRLVDMEGLT